MPKVTLIEYSGEEHTIEAEVDKTLMQNALDNMVPGVDADCGGACACGTCHCFIDDDWRETSGDVNPLEDAMLGIRPDRTSASRLSCQIDVTSEMDGMIVRLPEFQM